MIANFGTLVWLLVCCSIGAFRNAVDSADVDNAATLPPSLRMPSFWRYLGKESGASLAASMASSASPYDDKLCRTQFNEVVQATSRMEMWAVSMIDSCGKLPSGILSGNDNDFGSFDACLKIRPTAQTPIHSIRSQYCLAEMYADNPIVAPDFAYPIKPKGMDARLMSAQASNQSLMIVYVGLCMPDTCSPQMIVQIVDGWMEKFNLPVRTSVTQQLCTRQDPRPMRTLDVITISIFVAFAAMLALSTIYDLMQIYLGKPKNAYLITFSLYTNGQILFRRNQPTSDMLSCLHGIRVLSITWVIVGHSYLIMSISPLVNRIQLLTWAKSSFSMVLISGTVSVDSFLLMSGLLVSWIALKTMDQRNGKLNIPLMYLHRYIRLTPALAFAILLCSSLIRHFGDGPLWHTYMNVADLPCLDNWWSTLLYVQNYVNPSQMCVSHSWYLSVDMQLYLLSPLLLYPLWHWKIKSFAITIALAVISVASTLVIFIQNEFSVRLSNNLLGGKRAELTYYPTHCRAAAWLIGLMLGYILHELRDKTIRIPKKWVAVGWTLSLSTFFAVISLNYPLQVPTFEESLIAGAFYEAISRPIWAAALAWLVFACSFGYGGPINWFLSLAGWQPLARLSYSMYILHLPIQLALAAQVRVPAYFSDTAALYSFWGAFGFTICLACLWSLAFESPIMALERILLAPQLMREKNVSQEELVTQDTTVGPSMTAREAATINGKLDQC